MADLPAEKDQTALDFTGVEITDTDRYGYFPEKPLITFVSIRQKPLMSDGGKETEREAGGFKFNDPVALEQPPDKPELRGVIVASQVGRVYFESVGDLQPKCKSLDGLKSWNGFGLECRKCEKSQWETGRPDCREIRNLCFLDLDTMKGYMLTLSPSGLKPWRIYDQRINSLEKGIHHFVEVKVTTDYREEPAPHYIPVFEPLAVLDKKLRDQMSTAREGFITAFSIAAEKYEPPAEEFLGSPKEKDATPF